MSKLFDALIVGGGPAGLSAATTLARQVRSAVVFDSGIYRNALSKHMHTVPTWDHQDPAAFRAKARQDLKARYPLIEFADIKVEQIQKLPDGCFVIHDASGKEWKGKKVVIATGVKDVYPDIDGYAECFSKGIFHCMYCHGYEERGSESAGMLLVGIMASAMAFHVAPMVARMARSVTLYTNGSDSLATELAEKATAMAFPTKFDTREIRRLEKGPKDAEVIIHFADGTTTTEAFLAHAPRTELNGPWAEQLGLEVQDGMVPGMPDFKVTPPFNQTSVHGVFAAGDCGTPMKAALSAIQQGGAAGAGVCMQLDSEGR